MRDIAEHILQALSEGRNTVLVTVVGSTGSSPRHAGSQMLVSADGLVCGTIGGGAVEGHGIAKARTLLGCSAGCVEDLALRQQGANSLGMACGGDATLLYSPVNCDDAAWHQVASKLVRCFNERVPATLALKCREGEASPESSVALLAGDVTAYPTPVTSPCRAHVAGDWFVMPVPIPVRAVVFGGGHVGRATIAALSRVGFACTLFECRPEFARLENAPDAQEIILGDYDNVAASLTLDERDFVLIMTHSHRTDIAVLGQALAQPLAYLGMIGSRKKIALACKCMREAGVSEAALDAVHMPIGLDIKAETPEEIAVSITAECIQQRANH